MNQTSDHIVIYRSQMDRMSDEFWIDFWMNHPAIIYFIMALFVATIVAIFIVVAYSIIKGRRF